MVYNNAAAAAIASRRMTLKLHELHYKLWPLLLSAQVASCNSNVLILPTICCGECVRTSDAAAPLPLVSVVCSARIIISCHKCLCYDDAHVQFTTFHMPLLRLPDNLQLIGILVILYMRYANNFIFSLLAKSGKGMKLHQL